MTLPTSGGTPLTRQLLDILVAWGVRRVYCCPGSTEAAVLDAFVGREDISLITVSHEATAMAAADAEARLSGNPGVVYVHTNVGLANTLAHLSAARNAHAPVLLLNGLKPSDLAGRDGFTTLPHPDLGLRDLVKWDRVPASSRGVPTDLERALAIATAEPCGPVWVGLPQELLDSIAEVDGQFPRPLPPSRTSRPSRTATQTCAGLLEGARRPVIVSGADVARHRATAGTIRLAERLAAVVLHEERRGFERSSFPTSHPLYAGNYDAAHPAVRDADVVLFLGCPLFREFDDNGLPAMPVGATVIHAHVDPARIGRLHAVDHALVGDCSEIVADLVEAMTRPPAAEPRLATMWAGPTPGNVGSSPAHRDLGVWIEAICEGLTGTERYILDATTAGPALLGALCQDDPDQVVTTTSGSLGWGVGAAVGAALSLPERHVVAFLGDGVTQFCLPALWTAQKYDADVTFVVLNNQAYAAVGLALGRFAGEAVRTGTWPGTDISGPHLAAVAAGLGLSSQRLDRPDDVAGAMRRARTSPGPAVLELMTTGPMP